MTGMKASASQMDAAWELIIREGNNVPDEVVMAKTGVCRWTVGNMRGTRRNAARRLDKLTGHWPIDDDSAVQIANHKAWRVVRCMAGSGISNAELVDRAGVNEATVGAMKRVLKQIMERGLPITGFWLRDIEGLSIRNEVPMHKNPTAAQKDIVWDHIRNGSVDAHGNRRSLESLLDELVISDRIVVTMQARLRVMRAENIPITGNWTLDSGSKVQARLNAAWAIVKAHESNGLTYNALANMTGEDNATIRAMVLNLQIMRLRGTAPTAFWATDRLPQEDIKAFAKVIKEAAE